MTPFRLFRLWALVAITSTAVWGEDTKLSADLAQHPRAAVKSKAIDVIVQYRTTPTEAHHRRVADLGGKLNAKMDFIKGAHYTVPASALEALSQDPDVAYISPDRPIRPTFDNITNGTISASYETSKGWIGTGVGVAIIDSGVVDLPDFHTGSTSRIVYQQSFVGGSPADQYGHGTHVAGILAGNGNGTVYQGVAYNANIVNLRVLDAQGNGTDSAVIQAIATAIELKSKYNIRVINLSLGRPVYESASRDPLCQAVEAAWKAGIFVAVAAGNDGRNNDQATMGYGTITAPGNDPYVMTVGAIKTEGTTDRSDDRIASYSSKGPTLFDHYAKPDVVAPGNMVVSTLPEGLTLSNLYPGNRIGKTEYFILSGTSMATPVVAAWAAMGYQCNPSMTNDDIKADFMMSATKNFPVSSVTVDPVTHISYTSYYDVFTVGAGELDMLYIDSISFAPVGYSAKTPAVAYNPSAGNVTLQGVGAANVVWGSNVVWGANVVWGSSAVLANNVVWGANVVWGSSWLQGFNVVWGSNVVWGASTTDSSEAAAIAINGEP